MPNKAPAFQFYVGDYLQDTRCLSLAAKGAWTDCLCAMWRSPVKGEITYPIIGFARLFGCTVDQAEAVIGELVEMQICDSVTHSDGKVTVINRRMKREATEREQANNRQNKYRKRLKHGSDASGDADGDANVTTPSSTSTSFSSSDEKEKGGGGGNGKPPAAAEFSQNGNDKETLSDYLLRKQLQYPRINVPQVYENFKSLCGSSKYPLLRNTKRQFDKWLAGQEEELPDDIAQAPETRQAKIEACSLCDEKGYRKIGGAVSICRHEPEKINGGKN